MPNSLPESMPKAISFPGIDQIVKSFRDESFLTLRLRKRFKQINQILCRLIQEAPPEAFLLSSVLDYIQRVNHEKVLDEPLNFAAFEFWLNIFSSFTEQENYQIRSKIVGKYIPRSDYQAFFPIGMDRTFTGTHFIAAHLSPDVDTMVASFWGWVDAFAARIGTGLHLWSLPGGPPDSPISSILREMFGQGIFTYLARTSQTLTLTAMDLVTQQQMDKALGNRVTGEFEYGGRENAIILVNENGQYLGDWRLSDVEMIRPIIIIFKSCLRWFENNLHTKLISLFAKNDLSISDLSAFNSSVFEVKIKDSKPALDFSEVQERDLNEFLIKILGMKNGLESTFGDLNQSLKSLGMPQMALFQNEIENLPHSGIFDSKGKLIENRPKIFILLDKIIKDLDQSIHHVRDYVERLDVLLGIKHKVLNQPLLFLTLRSDVEEMRQKIQNYDFLTVVIYEKDGSLFPVGIVRAADLRKTSLGTVSLRDFCNQEEIRMASYLEIISVVDHHKSNLKTSSVPSAIIGDAQSCNVLVTEQAFLINDRYSVGGMTLDSIEKQINQVNRQAESPSQARLLQRLLKRQMAHHAKGTYFIHPDREFNEYLSCLHAILDDTDLLTKVSNRDVECVAQILNRLKSLSLREEVEVIHFDDIPRDKEFAKMAAQRILKNQDMYSLYKKIYDYRELEVEENLKLCSQEKPSNIFVDTKELNGCARVGQTKMFASNFQKFLEFAHKIRKIWFEQAQEVNRDHPEIDFHLHMISTIASTEEVYKGQIGPYKHRDELWLWAPSKQQGYDHLASFLANFQQVGNELNKVDSLEVEFLGPNAEEMKQIFDQNFISIPQKVASDYKEGLPIAVMRFKAGALNSRKSMITPFIPRLIT